MKAIQFHFIYEELDLIFHEHSNKISTAEEDDRTIISSEISESLLYSV